MEKIYQYIDEHKDMYIEWLQDLCRMPSVSAQKRQIKETAQLVEQYLKKIGVAGEQVETPGNPIVYGELHQNQEKTLAFYNHYDVQPEDPIELWKSDPFAAEIRDGRIFARGVADNKGNLVARICAVHAYLQVYGRLPVNIKFVVDGEEEVGSVHTHEISEKYPEKIKADGYIWESGYRNSDGRLQVRLGVKGMLYVELIATGGSADIHSLNAGIIMNPVWRLIWALNSLKNEKEEILIDHFYDRCAKPTERERQILADMVFQEEDTLRSFGLDSFLLGVSGYELKEKFIFQPTCTICGIEAGYTGPGSKTIIPAKAKAKLDFRLVADQDPEEILQLLRVHLDKHGFEDIEIVKISGKRGARTDPSDPLATTVMKVAEQFTGKSPQILINSPGTGPMYKLVNRYGIPAVGFGVGNHESRIHGPNENILIEDYIAGIKMVATVLEQYSSSKNG